MIKASVTVEDAIVLLNEALIADPKAMEALVKARVRCNQKLADHPTIQIHWDGENKYSVGGIGILNGLFGIDDRGMGAIAAVFDDNTHELVGFKRL